MSNDEFVDWMAFYQLQPFGPWRSDTQAALIASTMANANAKKGKSFAIDDFRLKFTPRFAPRRRTSISGEQVLSFFQSLATKQKGAA
jgi:hypothetical protein